MKKVFSILLILILIIFPLYSYYFEGVSIKDLRVVETEHFEFIYDDGAANKTSLLYKNGEGFYSDISNKLDSSFVLKIPVVVTSRVKSFNGYYGFEGIERIIVLDTFYSREEMSIAGNVFYHELTHAISLNQRHPFIQKIANVLGPYVNLGTSFNLPMNFVEGITVFLENARLNDSFFASRLFQAKLDNEFPKSWLNISSARDISPVGEMYYVYGGRFVKYLAQTYSQQKIAEFYKEAGNFHFGFVASMFKKVFNVSINQAFEDFSQTIKVRPVINEDRVLATTGYIADIDYDDGKLYFADYRVGILGSFDLATSKLHKEKYHSVLMNIDYNNKNKVLSVSDDDFAYLLFNNKKVDDLFIGSSFNGKLVGVNTEGFVFDNGVLKVPNNFMVTDLVCIDENTVVAIIFDGSVSYLTIVDLSTSTIKWIENKEAVFFRGLDFNGQVVTVGFNTRDDSLAGYAKLDLATDTLYKSTVEVNGGLNSPILIGEEVYYAAIHYDWADLCVIKESSLKLEETKITYFDFVPTTVDVPSLLSISKPYKPFSYFSKGSILPVASNILGPGVSYLVCDPAEAFILSSSLGYDVKSKNLAFSTSFSDHRFKIDMTHSLGALYGFENRNYNISYENRLEYGVRFPSQSKIELHCQAFGRLDYYKTLRFSGSFSASLNLVNLISFNLTPSYQNGRFDLSSSLRFSLSRLLPFENPKGFTLNLPTTITLSHNMSVNSLTLTTSTKVFKYQIQEGINFLSMYVRDLSLDFSYSLLYYLNERLKASMYKMTAYVHLVPVVGSIGSKFNTKLGLTASLKPQGGFACSFYYSVGD